MTRRTLLVSGLLGIPVIGLGWWLGSPLFLDQSVDEEFPTTVGATVPDSMTRAEVEEEMSSFAERTEEAAEPMPEGGDSAAALRRGEFRDADRFHRGAGTATLYRLADGGRILRLEDFEVTNGPDLRVLLAVHPGPSNRADLDASGYVELGPLKGNVGSQNYVIPADVDLAAQGSIVIYCRPFHVVFSVAPLGEVLR